MEVQFAPNSVDEPNFLFKLQRKIKVFNTTDSLGNRGYNLVASSSKYGIVFVASPDGFLSSYYLKELIDKDCQAKSFKLKLPEKPTHIAISCDHEYLAVTGGKMLLIYKVNDFRNMNISPAVDLLTSVRNELNSCVSALTWNPCIPDTIAMALYDGSLIVSQLSTSQTKKIQSKARCICWSPKGKQLVVGNSDGTLCQYKPDLSPMKTIPAPNLFENCPVEVMAIYWISTFQFAVIYKNATDNSRPAVTIVNTPKGGQPSCLNYEDICYSIGSNRPWYYYLQGIAQWNLILASSSNSMEIASLGSADGVSWLQWCQPDEARPELPLTDKKQENYPVGVAIDTCAIHQLPWGENQTLPHMPLLHVVSQTGLLTIFNIINLNNHAAQLCIPPTPLDLPANAMTSDIPGEVAPTQPPVQAPAPVVQKPQPVPTQPPPEQSVSSPFGASAFGSTANTSKPFGMPSVQSAASYSPAVSTTQAPLPQPQEEKPVATPITKPQAEQKQQPTPVPLSTQLNTQTPEMKAALKAEQESANKLLREQELKSMLVKEVNDFQMELYAFRLETNQVQLQIQKDLKALEPLDDLQYLDQYQLTKDCSIDELRSAVINLKLELVRACAVVAEARTQSEVKELQEWTHADPLTMKRVASIKNLSYYVQTQIERAQKALDLKWGEIAVLRDQRTVKPGHRMIRPILDDVYQPLVKQQEILGRQQAVLKVLKKTLNDCNISPIFKSTSILRTTPFKKDPLSKLTKNILNMSIEPETKNKNFLNSQKLDALRDMLANRQPNKIKPANIEIAEQLSAMRLSYQKSVKDQPQPISRMETKQLQVTPKLDANTQTPSQPATLVEPSPAQSYMLKRGVQPATTLPPLSQDKRPETQTPQPVINIPSFTPVSAIPSIPGLNNVARTLFTEEPSKELNKPAQPVKIPQTLPPQKPFASPLQSSEVKSALRNILQEKQNNLTDKSDGNTFMGQKICSPTAFGAPPPQVDAPSNGLTTKPIAEMSNVFNKFPTQPFSVGNTVLATPKTVKSDETGEIIKPSDVKPKEEKQMTNLFGLKPSTNVTIGTKTILDQPKPLPFAKPEVKEEIKTEDKVIEKPKDVLKPPETLKENVPEKKLTSDKENESKLFGGQSSNKTSIFGSNSATTSPSLSVSSTETTKPKESVVESKADPAKATEEPKSPTASSLFASANTATSKPQSLLGSPISPTTQSSSVFGSSTATSPASSIFASAAASSPPSLFDTKTTQSGSIFGTTSTSVFGTQGSVFGTKSEGDAKSALNSSPSLFGTSAKSEGEAKSVFGTGSASPSAVFGSNPAFSTSTTQPPAFSAPSSVPTTPQTTSQSIFATAATTSQSVFGTNTSTAQSSFGATQPFSSPTTQSSIFGATTQTSVFGAAATQPSIFATQTQSVFGGASQPAFGASTTQSSIFGGATTTQASQSVFGSPSQQSQASSVFGGQNTSVFGAPATTQTSSLFGGAESNMFASASISTTSASQTSVGNIFGGGSSGSVFGGNANSGGNIFGKSAFGQSTPSPASIFGGANQNSTFGQKQEPATDLWAGGQPTSAFGSSVFGQTATTQSSSVFGTGSFSSQGSAFGSPQQTSTFGAASGEAKPSLFGSPQQQSGFGASAGFGSAPAFGQSAGFGSQSTESSGFGSFGGFNKSPSSGFGSSATFGGGATFGAPAFGSTSPGKVFGAAGSTPGFGTSSQSSNATFENLATQNTLTFGNLAQQGTPSAQPAPSFNTSPSFTGWRS